MAQSKAVQYRSNTENIIGYYFPDIYKIDGIVILAVYKLYTRDNGRHLVYP